MGNNLSEHRAAILYEEFTGHESDEPFIIEIPELPQAAAVIGELNALIYTTIRDGKKEIYKHEFDNTPILAVADDGRHLLIIGGNYEFTDRGIEG